MWQTNKQLKQTKNLPSYIDSTNYNITCDNHKGNSQMDYITLEMVVDFTYHQDVLNVSY